MDFENVGFLKTMKNGSLKYLCCADCDLGVLGVQLLGNGNDKCYVHAGRVRYMISCVPNNNQPSKPLPNSA
jgi:hypothetical protein